MSSILSSSVEKNSGKNLHVGPLNGLRGLAAILVLLSHTSNADYYSFPNADFSGNGKAGVYLFFLLSSFLLSRPFFLKGGNSYTRKALKVYWKRRFLRVYPLYFCYVLLFGVATYLFARFIGYDLGAFAFSPMMVIRQLLLLEAWGVTWTIIVEFKFYLILPLVTFLVLQCERKLPPIAVPVFLLSSIGFLLLLFPPSTLENNDISLWGYCYIFLVGVLMGWVDIRYADKLVNLKRNKVLNLLGFLGAIAVVILTPSVYSALFYNVPFDHFHTRPIPHILAWILVMFSAIYGAGYLSRILNSKVLTYAGTISFSIYLLHSPIISFSRRIGVSGVSGFWFIVIATAVASVIAYNLIEKPSSRLR